MRMITGILIFALMALTARPTSAQTAGQTGYVTWNYKNKPLEEVLADISDRYQIQFSYSRDFLLLDQRISARSNALPVNTALEQLFAETDIVFARIGSQVALRRDPDKQLSLRPTVSEDKSEMLKEGTGEQSLTQTDTLRTDSLVLDSLVLDTFDLTFEDPDTLVNDLDRSDTLTRKEIRKQRREQATAWAEITLMPGYEVRSMQTADERFLNINLLYGKHDSIRGIELGLLVNEITEYAEGIQAAGVFNRVDGQFAGLQWAGFINQVSGPVEGLQVAGLLNTSGNNYGIQASGLGNLSNGNASAQVASMFNIASGRAGIQAAGLFNLADKVTHGQVSTFINVADHVEGFQLGLINIADSIAGPSIGLLNFIRKGYNHIELFAGEALYGNISLKLGSHRFYNIIETGTNLGVREWTDEPRSWALGYGVGFHRKVGKEKNWGMNLEVLAMQVNEGTFWQNDLNLLTKARILWKGERNGENGLYFGPTFNLLISQWQDSEGTFLTEIAPYSIWENESSHTRLQGWIGLQLGYRF